MKRIVIPFIVLCLVTVAAFADYSAVYIAGTVEYESAGRWRALRIGDTMPAGARIRLTEGSAAEIVGAGSTLRLSRAGVYELAELAASTQRTRAINIDTMIGSRVRRLSTADTDRSTPTAGGVRASEAVAGPETIWVGGESPEDLIEEGIELIELGWIDDAFFVFEEAFDYATGPTRDKAQFLLGYTAAMLDDVFHAIDLLSSPGPDRSTEYFDEHSILLARLHVETFALADAESVLTRYIAASPSDTDALQTAQLLLGVAYRNAGRIDSARTAFFDTIGVAPGSELADAARELIAEMP
ncbi:MAG: hypothetical protein EA426_02510 [Spirochaetaceae bacterium]|nr:MAG: hypothetical protein EA426_02510 [Spirochaetaceae bacterium]